MSTQRILVLTVLADAVLSIASFVIDFTGFATRDTDYESLLASMEMPLFLLFLALLVAGWVGILRFWSPARYCYVGAWVITLAQYAAAESYRAPGWLYALYHVVAITGGFLIALIFCSDLHKRYVSQRNKPPHPAGAMRLSM